MSASRNQETESDDPMGLSRILRSQTESGSGDQAVPSDDPRQFGTLVYDDGLKKWWRQRGVNVGETATRIHVGEPRTKPGTQFTVVAMTTEELLAEPSYLNLPEHRTISEEIILVRK
jgi:hypothetical protein